MKQIVELEIAELGEQGYHLFCRGNLNGKRIRVLIDTGASKSVLSREFANKLTHLRIIQAPENTTQGIGPETIDSEFARIRTLRFGKARISGLIVGVVDLQHVSAVYEQLGIIPFDFLLGCDVLLELNAVIDLGQGIMTLQSRKTPQQG